MTSPGGGPRGQQAEQDGRRAADAQEQGDLEDLGVADVVEQREGEDQRHAHGGDGAQGALDERVTLGGIGRLHVAVDRRERGDRHCAGEGSKAGAAREGQRTKDEGRTTSPR